MVDSSLLKLPPELRNRIYELVLRRNTPVIARWCNDSKRFHQITEREDAGIFYALAITTTCKTIRSECRKLFYAFNTFEFQVSAQDSHHRNRALNNILTAIGDPVSEHNIGCITLDLGVLSGNSSSALYITVDEAQQRIVATNPDVPLRVKAKCTYGYTVLKPLGEVVLELEMQQLGDTIREPLAEVRARKAAETRAKPLWDLDALEKVLWRLQFITNTYADGEG